MLVITIAMPPYTMTKVHTQLSIGAPNGDQPTQYSTSAVAPAESTAYRLI